MIQLNYRRPDEYRPVDLEKLRPKDSYKTLIEKRSHPIQALLEKHGSIPKEFLISRPCPNCSSKDSKFELEKDHLTLVRCASCSLVYTNPLFDEAHYDSIYKSGEYSEIMSSLVIQSHEYRVERFGRERVEILKRFLSSDIVPKYLDVGCATGFVVEAATKAGWDAQGIELNPVAVDYAKSRGLNVVQGKLDTSNLVRESFDVISMFDVLEHLSDPAEITQQAIEYLKPGGLLFLYVPNYDSASRILMGAEAHFIWPTHHLTYFNIETITDFLKRRGLKIELTVTEGLDIADYIWYQEAVQAKDQSALLLIANHLQFFINAGGYGKNLRVIARKLH